jgi:hypothetical protein
MPNGTDCSNILQTEALCVPTQWFVLDCARDGRVSKWLRADLSGEIDYLHLDADADAVDAKAALKKLRPKVLRELADTGDRRRSEGSLGRLVVWIIADLAEPLGNLLLAELPLDLSNATFWSSSNVPAVIRAGIGGSAADRRRCLSVVRDQYFGRPDFSKPYYGKHEPGQLYDNEFDSTLLCDNDDEMRSIIELLVPLHLAETKFAKAHLQRHQRGGMFVIEQVMKNSLQWRKIDWLAVTSYPYFRRLWTAGQQDILELLDYRRCPERANDPWAALKGRQREKNWNDLNLDPAAFNPLQDEEPYRVTDGDHRTRFLLAGFLLRHKLNDDVFQQCEIGRAEGGYPNNPKWTKIEGLALSALGRKDEGRELLSVYRRKLQEERSPSADVLDEIASMALFEGEFQLAFDTARQAVAKDKFLGHAYDTMVWAGRESGNSEYERSATELAKQNGVTVPIHVREQTNKVLKTAKVVKSPPVKKAVPKKWWQFWE